jgi:hypothetical protein
MIERYDDTLNEIVVCDEPADSIAPAALLNF